jgi:7-alpha-hydroxysteroid dehydrogenase
MALEKGVLDRFGLRDRVGIVTGAGKGIGAAIAVAFAEAGADVAVMARTPDDLDRVAEDVRARGRRALTVPGDVNDLALLSEVVERTASELGGVDVVVNNAGGSIAHPFLETSVQDLEEAFHFQVSAPFELSRLALPHMLARDGGSIINISSVAGRKALRGTLSYSTAKAALSQLTRVMAADLAPRVRVNAILPGAVDTPSLHGWLSAMDDAAREGLLSRIPMRRTGKPVDIALAAVYLASSASSWVTGKLLEVDGAEADDLVPIRIPDV